MDRTVLDMHIAEGESLTQEFKGEERAVLNDRDLVEAVICLANADGGLLFVGVEDDGRITGARLRHCSQTDLWTFMNVYGRILIWRVEP